MRARNLKPSYFSTPCSRRRSGETATTATEKVAAAARNTTGEVQSRGGDRKSEQAESMLESSIDSQSARAERNGVSRFTQQRLDRLARDYPDLHQKVIDKFRALMASEIGEREFDRLTASESVQGERRDLTQEATSCVTSKKLKAGGEKTSRLRAINRAPAPIQRLYDRDLLAVDLAAARTDLYSPRA